MSRRFLGTGAAILLLLATSLAISEPELPHPLFETAGTCISCHNGLVTPAGEDVSIGTSWRASMMANAARDPYWQAAVRRETIDHPEAQAAIEEECSTCHMPMAHVQAEASGLQPAVFAHLPIGASILDEDLLAADGVSCTVCHQISADGLGSPESFTGRFRIDAQRKIFGPFEIDAGRSAVMQSASTFRPAAASHIQQSELCASCHTLFTHSLGPGGQTLGELPEQVPYLEWRHSAYREERSCQSCHMPSLADSTAISSVVGQPRAGFSRHVFRGGNFFMLRLLNRFGGELGVEALPQELDATMNRTLQHLQSSAALLSIERLEHSGGKLRAEVTVENLAGHKLPTAYPSRRAWLHFAVHDRTGRLVFESGAFRPDGSIAGNDNDADAARYEPHYSEIVRSDQVQVYETIMADPAGAVTTGLLTAVRYVKDNRILPRGFDKATAGDDIAVHGLAAADPDFSAASDRVTYAVDLGTSLPPYQVHVELWYQPVAFRWAQNLLAYEAQETKRFTRYYDSMADVSAVILASAEATAQ